MVFLPPYQSPSFPVHRRLNEQTSLRTGSTVQTRRILYANRGRRTGTKPERLATPTLMRPFMEGLVPESEKRRGLHAPAVRLFTTDAK